MSWLSNLLSKNQPLGRGLGLWTPTSKLGTMETAMQQDWIRAAMHPTSLSSILPAVDPAMAHARALITGDKSYIPGGDRASAHNLGLSQQAEMNLSTAIALGGLGYGFGLFGGGGSGGVAAGSEGASGTTAGGTTAGITGGGSSAPSWMKWLKMGSKFGGMGGMGGLGGAGASGTKSGMLSLSDLQSISDDTSLTKNIAPYAIGLANLLSDAGKIPAPSEGSL